MENTTKGSHTWPPRKGAVLAFVQEGGSLGVRSPGACHKDPLRGALGEACGGSGGKIRCLGSQRTQHLLRKFVFINVRGQAALPPYLKAPCSSRKARAGGLRWAGSWLPCSELAASPRVFPNRWVQILPHPGARPY